MFLSTHLILTKTLWGCILVSSCCCHKLPQTMVEHSTDLLSHIPGGQKSKHQDVGRTLCLLEARRGFLSLSCPTFGGPFLHHPEVHHSSFCFCCLLVFSDSLLERPSWLLGAPVDNPGWSPRLKVHILITSTESLLPHEVTHSQD